MADEALMAVAEQGIEYANEEAGSELEQQIKVSDVEVRIAAQHLVDYAMLLESQWNAAKGIMRSLGENEDPTTKVVQFQKKMVQTKEQFQEMMTFVFDLQNVINEYLGQTVQMVYTYIDNKGNVEIYKFDNTIDHLKVDTASQSHGGAYSGRIAFTKAQRNGLEKLIKEDYDSSSLDATFKEVHERYTISKQRIKMRGAFYIFWNTGGGWQGSRVTGAGALGESYFQFYINEYTFTSFVEAAVGDFMTNPNYGVEIGDSTSGFLQGDVTRDNIEYGVKAQGASALGYSDIIKYAQEILLAPDLTEYLIGPGGLKERLREAGNQNLARRVLAEEMDATVDALLEEYLKKGKGNLFATFS